MTWANSIKGKLVKLAKKGEPQSFAVQAMIWPPKDKPTQDIKDVEKYVYDALASINDDRRRLLIAACRRLAHNPQLIFKSSVSYWDKENLLRDMFIKFGLFRNPIKSGVLVGQK